MTSKTTTATPAATAETIADLRDGQLLSWVKVADALGLATIFHKAA